MIYGWQYLHSLTLFTEVLCTYNSQQDLQLLVYPLVQVISGAVQLLPVQKYFPFAFHAIRLLHRLAGSNNIYIPTLPFLTKVLENQDFKKKFKPSSEKPLDWACAIKVPKSLIHTRVLFDDVVEYLFDLLLEHFSLYAYSISFPELTVSVTFSLKQFIKSCRVPEYSKTFKQLLQQVGLFIYCFLNMFS